MSKPVLVIMAAGMGSRFGGMKQIEPLDAYGNIIMDFSMFDACRAGFEKAIIVIKEENEQQFREVIGNHLANHMEVSYAYQRLTDLPAGYTVPEGRIKPWGTGHAALSAMAQVDGSFAVINADDYYGVDAYRSIYDFLCTNKPNENAMVGYLLKNAITENGSVARGVCVTDPKGYLVSVTERTRIERYGDGGLGFTEDGGVTYTPLQEDTIVSMNLWGFGSDMKNELRDQFPAFLDHAMKENPLKAEYFLPSVASAQLAGGRGTVRVIPTHETWYGVTYRADLASVKDAIQKMKSAGIYPERLWR